ARSTEEAVGRAEPAPDDDREREEEDEKGEELEVERGDAHGRRVSNRPVDVSPWAGDELADSRDRRPQAVPHAAERPSPREAARPGRVELGVHERERRAALLPEHERVDEEAERRECQAGEAAG